MSPLVVEPDRLDFQGAGVEEEGKHEGIVHLVNQSDQEIILLFTDSSCRCTVAELPHCNIILPREKLLMKCVLSTVERITDRAGGEIMIAHRFADNNEEDAPPMYVCVILQAIVEP